MVPLQMRVIKCCLHMNTVLAYMKKIYDEKCRKIVEKGENARLTSIFSFSYNVFKKLSSKGR